MKRTVKHKLTCLSIMMLVPNRANRAHTSSPNNHFIINVGMNPVHRHIDLMIFKIPKSNNTFRINCGNVPFIIGEAHPLNLDTHNIEPFLKGWAEHCPHFKAIWVVGVNVQNCRVFNICQVYTKGNPIYFVLSPVSFEAAVGKE